MTQDETLERPTPGAFGPPPVPNIRSIVLALSGMVAALTFSLMVVLPLPYSVTRTGPTFDVFGEVDGRPIVRIDGAPTYEASGELRITTVAVPDGSGGGPSLGPLLRAWFSSRMAVEPEVDYEGVYAGAEQQWITSQEIATVAALTQLGERVPATLTLVEIAEESNAFGLLAIGDVIVGADGSPVRSWADLDEALKAREPGDAITLAVVRGGIEESVTFDTIDDGRGGALMGVFIDPDFETGVSVEVAIDNVGGPSGGLIFALAIVDRLTPRDELAGAHVAGTGTIDLDGDVGPIGGIALKMRGAAADGADWFLAPRSNCPEVVGNIPRGLDVVAVETLDEAYEAVMAIGAGRADGLPTCS